MIKGKKISELVEQTELTGNEFIPIQVGVQNMKIKTNKFATTEDVNEKNSQQDGKLSQLENDINNIKRYVDLYAYGIEWDVTSSDKHCVRIGNPLLHKSLPIQNAYRGCVAKGLNVQYYLHPDNWSKKVDGTPSVLDGTDGDVDVETPLFYGKSWEEGNKRRVMISTVKIDDTWIEIPRMLHGAYKPTVANGEARSVMNTTPEFRGGGNRADFDQYLNTIPSKSDLGKPRTNISRSTMRNYARKAGAELLCYEYYKWIFYWNYVIEYANFDSQDTFNNELTSDGYHQGGLGKSVTYWDWGQWTKLNGNYPITPCGYCNEIGNHTGVKELAIVTEDGINKTFEVSRWHGFDNIFGDVYTNLDGVVIKRDLANEPSRVMTTSDPRYFDDSEENKNLAGMEVPKDGYIKEFALGSTAEIIPSEIDGAGATYKCDYHYCNVSYTGDRTLLVGGHAYYAASAGVGCFYSISSVGNAYTFVGFRIVRVL